MVFFFLSVIDLSWYAQGKFNYEWQHNDSLQVCEWILYKSSFKPDIICYNLLIDAFGQNYQHKNAESIYLKLLEDRCVPTDDTYALLISAYCMSGLLHKAEAVFAEMRRSGVPPSMFPYHYIKNLCLSVWLEIVPGE